LSVLPVGFGSAAGTPAGAVERSLRFNSADSPSLTRTPSSSGSQTTFTHSMWVKRTALSSASYKTLYGSESSGANYVNFAFLQDTLYWTTYNGTTNITIQTSQVFRDVSAWYHIVVAVDTTQATDSNRVRLYVNGSRITAGTFNYPTLNQALQINTASFTHKIGFSAGFSQYFDGYMTEINFLDGYPTVGGTTYNATTWAALNVSTLFGETDSATGVWKPKAYSGTYGTNGFYLPFKTASNWSGYFDGSNDYLSVPSNSAWQYGTGDFCVEGWFLGTTAGSLSNQYLFGRYNTSVSAYGALQLANSTSFYWYYGSGGAYGFTLGTALTTNRWYHVAVSRSGTSLRFFLDGTQVGSTQTDNTNYGGTAEFRVINAHQSSATYFPGYISNVRVVKGSAVYTSNFTPSTSQLTAITNTVLLTCQSSTFVDNSTNAFTITNNGGALNQQFSPFALDVTDDHSGTGNNLQPNNLDLRTTGVGADILVDSPTAYGTDTGVGGEVRGNYATFNALKKADGYTSLTNGNLYLSSTSGGHSGFATIACPTSGKWYFEVTFDSGTSPNTFTNAIGLGDTESNLSAMSDYSFDVAGINTVHYAGFLGKIRKNVGATVTDLQTSLATPSASDTIGVAYNADSNEVSFYKNGTILGSAQSLSGIGSGKWTFFAAAHNLIDLNGNFGQRAFAYTAPSGFKALCTTNLPTPTIGATSTTQAGEYMNVLTYTGTGGSSGATRSFTGLGFQPDFIWQKARSSGSGHRLHDAIRGAGLGKYLQSNTTNAEGSGGNSESLYGYLSSFDSDGFTATNGTSTFDNWNKTSDTYVAWAWNAGGSNATNTSGTITSTVRANTTSGFSIVTYTGNFTASQTVGHGLSTAPVFIITKRRDSTSDWGCIHPSLAATQIIRFNLTGAAETNDWFANTRPTSSVFYVGQNSNTNPSGGTMVAYVFAPVAGYSTFGSYTGNAAADGPFIYTGFRPRFVIRKCSSATSNWFINDAARNPSNVVLLRLNADLSDAESSGANSDIDFLSNGFKIRATSTAGVNQSGQTHIYMAFAENPFKYSLAR